jgi:hypothetical protein
VALEEARAKGLDVSTTQGYMNNMPLYDLVKKMPSTKISNYMYANDGDLHFSNETTHWGLDEPGVSSGATYADLDNDGDLDLIVCNNNDPVWTYKNHTNEIKGNNFIKVKLAGDRKNVFGIGAKVIVKTEAGEQMQEMFPVRGYQSSVDYVLNFGLGKQQSVKEIKVLWSADSATIVSNPHINSLVEIRKKYAEKILPREREAKTLFEDISAMAGIDFIQTENRYTDFKREFLIPYELSRQGPKMAKGDVNGDGLEDIFIGGPARQAGVLYLQTTGAKFMRAASQPWQADALCEDVNAVFFDADNDKDLDLYVVSGGSEWLMAGNELQDRLYLNDGKGNFVKTENVLPAEVISGTCVEAADFDNDGDLDLFIGASAIPGHYPISAGNLVLRNDFDPSTYQLRCTDITGTLVGDALFRAGMVKDASWTDIDKDGWQDLVIAGEWMPIMIFRNEQGKKLTDISKLSGLEKSNGWWCKILPADIDHDGDMDFILGNMGLNTQFRTNEQEPLVTYALDFDNNGQLDPIMTWYIHGVSYPFNSRDEVTGQLPVLNKKFLRYSDFGKATINDMFSQEQLDEARTFYVYHTETSLLINNDGKFVLKPLPGEAQFSAVNSMLYNDYDGDGKEDILLTGNFYPFRVQQGPCDAGLGALLKGDGKGNFSPVPRKRTALYVRGDVRDMMQLNDGLIIVSKNEDAVQVLKAN